MVLPLPLAADDNVSQLALLAAVHAQPAPAVSVTLPEPPPEAMLALDELSVYVHAVRLINHERLAADRNGSTARRTAVRGHGVIQRPARRSARPCADRQPRRIGRGIPGAACACRNAE